MENLRNKSEYITKKAKEYFDRFTKLNIYSYTKPGDNKIYIGAKPTEVYSLFNGNTSSTKKTLTPTTEFIHPDDIVVDQSSLQYYIILGLQDFYQNYYLPLEQENQSLKDNLSMLQTLVSTNKKKNDERFDVLTKNMEALAFHVNNLKK